MYENTDILEIDKYVFTLCERYSGNYISVSESLGRGNTTQLCTLSIELYDKNEIFDSLYEIIKSSSEKSISNLIKLMEQRFTFKNELVGQILNFDCVKRYSSNSKLGFFYDKLGLHKEMANAYGVKEKDVINMNFKVTEVSNTTNGLEEDDLSNFALYCIESNDFPRSYIRPCFVGTKMCFPDGGKNDLKKGSLFIKLLAIE